MPVSANSHDWTKEEREYVKAVLDQEGGVAAWDAAHRIVWISEALAELSDEALSSVGETADWLDEMLVETFLDLCARGRQRPRPRRNSG